VRDGDQVEVGALFPAGQAGSSDGTRVRGAARLRASVPGGSVFLVEGTHEQPANMLTKPLVAVRRVGGASERSEAEPVIVTPAGEGHAEAPASAPLKLPPVDPRPEGGKR
jgi:hypothetical protein